MIRIVLNTFDKIILELSLPVVIFGCFLCFTARVQPIIGSSHPDMISDHFLPIAKKIRDNAMIVEQKEKQLSLSKMHQHNLDDDSDMEANVQLVSLL